VFRPHTAFLVLITCSVAPLWAQGTLTLDDIVHRLEKAQAENREQARAYTIKREYRLFKGDDSRPDSSVTAAISFLPPDTKSYNIEQTHGSDRGEKVVRKILERETDMADDPRKTILSRDNYRFHFIGPARMDGRRCYLLGLEPKREEKELVRGRVWVDASTYLPVRVEGKLAKNPSWWLKNVDVVLKFGHFGGLWMEHATQASAEVRLFGRHTLTSRMVDARIAQQVATTAAPGLSAAPILGTSRTVKNKSSSGKAVKRRPTQPVPALLGAGVLVR